MPEKQPDIWIVIIMYAIAAVSGAFGGCAAGAVHVIKMGRHRRLLGFFLAYVFIGLVCGMLTYAFGGFFGLKVDNPHDLIGSALLAGTFFPLILASQNFAARLILKRFGIEVQVTIKRKNDSRNEKGGSDE